MTLFFVLNPKRQQATWAFETAKKIKKQIEQTDPAPITIDQPDDEEAIRAFLKKRKRRIAEAVQMIMNLLE